jgi:hypothetical protein
MHKRRWVSILQRTFFLIPSTNFAKCDLFSLKYVDINGLCEKVIHKMNLSPQGEKVIFLLLYYFITIFMLNHVKRYKTWRNTKIIFAYFISLKMLSFTLLASYTVILYLHISSDTCKNFFGVILDMSDCIKENLFCCIFR